MTWDEFMKGIAVLYAFGMAKRDEWELKIWYQALKDEMSLDSYEQSCLHLCKNNIKFWETDNIPAQLIATYEEIRQKLTTKLIAQRSHDDQSRRDREKQEAIDSYESEEHRQECIEKFKKMNRQTFRSMPR